jgi:hypothetical protein
MRTAKLAEFFLSLATTSERAASIVGDLVEETRGSTTLRFWWGCFHIAASLALRSVADAPLRVVWLSFAGLFIQILYSVMTSIVLLPLLVSVRGTWFHSLLGSPLVPTVPVFYFLGKWLARHAAHRELGVFLGVTFIPMAIFSILALFYDFGPDGIAWNLPTFILSIFVAFIGVQRQRRFSRPATS